MTTISAPLTAPDWGDGEKPSWWDKPMRDLTPGEMADAVVAIAEATRSLGNGVTVAISRSLEGE